MNWHGYAMSLRVVDGCPGLSLVYFVAVWTLFKKVNSVSWVCHFFLHITTLRPLVTGSAIETGLMTPKGMSCPAFSSSKSLRMGIGLLISTGDTVGSIIRGSGEDAVISDNFLCGAECVWCIVVQQPLLQLNHICFSSWYWQLCADLLGQLHCMGLSWMLFICLDVDAAKSTREGCSWDALPRAGKDDVMSSRLM